ncbi:class I SAM-dependent methyltransferase [Krasilnikovia cinnamomea]|nr:class I SAM-dependent methyltransferase [Krasilnikovia cinnamomea]
MAIAAHYDRLFETHHMSATGVEWPSDAIHHAVFDGLLRDVRLHRALSVLDVGCGYGALIGYLESRGCAPRRYLGVEVSRLALAAAQDRWPANCRFLLGDFSREDFEVEADFDLAVCAGALVHFVDPDGLHIATMIDKMLQASPCVVFNVISDADADAGYADPPVSGEPYVLGIPQLERVLDRLSGKWPTLQWHTHCAQTWPRSTDVFVRLTR